MCMGGIYGDRNVYAAGYLAMVWDFMFTMKHKCLSILSALMISLLDTINYYL